MKNYVLFLDESKPNGSSIKHMCLGGIIIKEEIYKKQVIPQVNLLKTEIFKTTDIILHEVEIRNARNDFVLLRKEETRKLFWEKLKPIYENNNIRTLGVAINKENYNRIYNEATNNDPYFIVLQIALENFVHFLEKNNVKGTVYIESQNSAYDSMLRNHYHRIISNGTLYLDKNVFQERLLNINFLIKEDNNIGLQLADFIPGTLNRKCNGLPPKTPSLLDIIEDLLYDGNLGLKDRFGFKELL